jgi:hypothetical protein
VALDETKLQPLIFDDRAITINRGMLHSMLTPLKDSRSRIYLETLLPLIFGAAVIFIDSLITSTTITPFALSLGLLLMAFYVSPRLIYFWSFIYITIIVLIFFNPVLGKLIVQNTNSMPNPNIPFDRYTPYFRVAHAACTAILACFLCYFLNKLRALLWEERNIVGSVPLPVITSDFNGNIRYANTQAMSLLNLSSHVPINASYFDLLAPKDQHGPFIAEYFKRMDGRCHEQPLAVECNEISMSASTRVMAFGPPKLLLTFIYPSAAEAT